MRILVALAAAASTALSGDFDRATAMVIVAAGTHAGAFLVRNTDSPCEIIEQRAPRPKHQFEVSIGGVTAQMDPTFAWNALQDRTRPDAKSTAGSGSVTIAQHDAQATVNFDVKTADGVQFKGVIQCSRLLRD